MATNNEGIPINVSDKLREVSKNISISTTVKMSVEDNQDTNVSVLTTPATQFDKPKVKQEPMPVEKDDDIFEGDVKETKDIKNENLDLSGNSEYIEDETGFEDMSYPPMEIDESVGYNFDGFVHPIHYTDVIEDDLNDIDEDSKDNDPDFGQKKKKKKKVQNESLIPRDDQMKIRRVAKPKILECTDDLTKIDHCEDNPNFAVVVDFIEKFGEHLGQKKIPIKDLQSMISDHDNEPHSDLIKLHTNLLRKTKLPKKTLITKKTWETALILFCHTTGGMVGEGLELQKLGYAQISLSLRLEILKNLMESQFDWNERIRMLVDDLPVETLRIEPTGTDIEGKIYWTQIDDHAEIRIYTEDYRHDTWGNVVQNRVELVSLLDKLKDEKLYKQELEKLKIHEADVQDQNAVIDVIAEMEKEQEVKTQGFNTEYTCEVCKLKFESKVAVMEHYSGGHMSFKLKEKFRHLVENGKCKMCKFEAANEKLIWIHIGAFHEKVNSVLKESKLKPIGDNTKSVNEEKTNPEVSEVPKPTAEPNGKNEDTAVINKLEKKIEELKYEMIDSGADNQPMTEASAGPKVQNNQECNEELSMMEGIEKRKVNPILNLDGITDIEENEVAPEASDKIEKDEPIVENNGVAKTARGKKVSNVKSKDIEEDTSSKGKRGRKRKADAQTVQNSEEDSKSMDINMEVVGKSADTKTKAKQKEPKNKADEEGNESVDRPRRGRACKEIAEILKVPDTNPIKKGKEKNTEKEEPIGKGQKENKGEKDIKEEINKTNPNNENNTKEDKNKKNKVDKSKKGKSQKEDNSNEANLKEEMEDKKEIKEENNEQNTNDGKNENDTKDVKNKNSKNEKGKRGRGKKEDNSNEANKTDDKKEEETKKEDTKKGGSKKPGTKKGVKKEEIVKEEDLEVKEPDTSVQQIKDEKTEKTKRGRTPRKNKAVLDVTAEVKEQRDVVQEEVKTDDPKSPKDQKKKSTSPVKKAAKTAIVKKIDNEIVINSTEVGVESQNLGLKEESLNSEKNAKGSQSKRAPSKKAQKEADNKKKIEENTENKDKTEKQTVTKGQGKRKGTGDETEKQTKKKKVEDTNTTNKNVRERKSRNVKKPVYDISDDIIDEDFISEENELLEKTLELTNQDQDKSKEDTVEEKTVKGKKGPKIKEKKVRQRKVKAEKKVIDIAKEMKVKKRKETKLSCKKCNQWKDGKESVFKCSNCEQGWHQHCAIPPLYHEPEEDWLCPLCHHVALVKKLEKTLAEFDILMERAEERRLADLIENQSRVTDDQYDDLNDYSYTGEKVNINVQVNPPLIKDIKRKNYYESSDEDAPESDDDEWGVQLTESCTCEGDGDCVYCKRMQGCTCNGHGTCRLCQAKSEKRNEKPGTKGPQKMSTTEMFMKTGKTRQTPDVVFDGFRYRGTARGRFMPRRMRRGRGGRGTGMGRGQPPTTSYTPSTPSTPSIGKNLPPGITITSTPAEKKPFSSLGIGRSLPPGITVMDSSGKDISHLAPKARAPVPELNLPGISLSRANEPPAKVIDIIDLSDSDDEPEILEQPPSMAVVPYRPPGQVQSGPYAPPQGGPRGQNQVGGRMQMQRRPMPPGMRRPMQQGGMMRPRAPMQQGGRIIVQNRGRPGTPLQRGNMVRRGGPPQRGSYPMSRGPSIQGQRGYPPQRRPIPVQGGMRPPRPGMRPMRPGMRPGMRPMQRPGMPSRRPMMRRPMGRIMSGGMRPRGPMMRPPQGGRGPRPMMRMRGRPMPGRGGPRPQITKQPDIVIPTVTPGHEPSPDMDIVADNADIPNMDGQDDRVVGYSSDENLSRLPQFIQVEKVLEYDVLDLE